jgi:hypothetical protein
LRHKAVLGCDIGALPGPPKQSNTQWKTPPKILSGTPLEVNDERYNATQMRALYESHRYPLARKHHPM